MEPVLETMPVCQSDDVCANIDPPFCHCLACGKSGLALSVWGECIECQICLICQQHSEDLQANGRCSKCQDCCSLCEEHCNELLEDGTCKACKMCPPDCANNRKPYCHCVGCGQRTKIDPKEGECDACLGR